MNAQINMSEAAPPPGQGGQGNGDGDENRHFWELIKSHYLDHPDDELLVAVVENGQFNPHLKLNNLEQIRLSLRKHVLALKTLQAPTDGLSLPVHPDLTTLTQKPSFTTRESIIISNGA